MNSLPHIAVTTCPRPRSYLEASLREMHRDELVRRCPLAILIDAPEKPNGLNEILHAVRPAPPHRYASRGELGHGSILVLPLVWGIREEANILIDPERRIYYATARALSTRVYNRPFILCQDDVAYEDRWLERALELADRIAIEQATDRYVFAIYNTYPGTHRNLGYTPVPVPAFHGHCCLYISAAAVEAIADRYWATRLTATQPDDMYMKEILLTTLPQISLYGAVPTLAHHVGEVSARRQDRAPDGC
jgi:hypothetical protein